MASLLKTRKKRNIAGVYFKTFRNRNGEADFNIPVRPNDKLVLQSDS